MPRLQPTSLAIAASAAPSRRRTCWHCGLPLLGPGRGDGEHWFCCYGCYLVSRIVGNQDQAGSSSWRLLRLGVGVFLSMDVMMISLLLYSGAIEPAMVEAFHWVLLALASPAMAILGYPYLSGAAGEFRRRQWSMDSLVAVGSFSAFGLSAYHTAAGWGEIYFDTATMLLVLVTFGKLIEAGAKARSSELVKSLQMLLPATAQRMRDGAVNEVALDELRAGDVLLVRAGQRVPVDGCVVEGAGCVDESAFTGEAQPRAYQAGDHIIAGSINAGGPLAVRASAVGHDLLLYRMIDSVEQAREQLPASQRLAEKAAAIFVPIVLAVALMAGAFHYLAGDTGRSGMAILAVLVVACPCALGIAGPLATAVAIARCARQGIVVRGGDVLENIARIGHVFFDKTGTLTAGRPRVQRIEPLDDDCNPDELLHILASLEQTSEHSVGRAVVEAWRESCNGRPGDAETASSVRPLCMAREVEVAPGLGISGAVDVAGKTIRVFAGNWSFVSRQLSSPSPCMNDADETRSVIYLAWAGQLRGRVLISDSLRANASAAIASLHEMAVNTTLLSGDRRSAAAAVAAEVGIDDVQAPRRPDEKIQAIRDARQLWRRHLAGKSTDNSDVCHASAPFACPELVEGSSAEACPAEIQEHASANNAEAWHPGSAPLSPAEAWHPSRADHVIAMVGDGVNDAPALAAADVGIALGAGTDLSRQAGNVILLGDQLEHIPWLIRYSRRVRRVVTQNLWWAFGYNAIALAAAAMGYLHPLLAAVAMVVSSLTLLGNSLRLGR